MTYDIKNIESVSNNLFLLRKMDTRFIIKIYIIIIVSIPVYLVFLQISEYLLLKEHYKIDLPIQQYFVLVFVFFNEIIFIQSLHFKFIKKIPIFIFFTISLFLIFSPQLNDVFNWTFYGNFQNEIQRINEDEILSIYINILTLIPSIAYGFCTVYLLKLTDTLNIKDDLPEIMKKVKNYFKYTTDLLKGDKLLNQYKFAWNQGEYLHNVSKNIQDLYSKPSMLGIFIRLILLVFLLLPVTIFLLYAIINVFLTYNRQLLNTIIIIILFEFMLIGMSFFIIRKWINDIIYYEKNGDRKNNLFNELKYLTSKGSIILFLQHNKKKKYHGYKNKNGYLILFSILNSDNNEKWKIKHTWKLFKRSSVFISNVNNIDE